MMNGGGAGAVQMGEGEKMFRQSRGLKKTAVFFVALFQTFSVVHGAAERLVATTEGEDAAAAAAAA